MSPFRSAAAESRYLAAYEEWSRAWPTPADERVVNTAFGSTFVRGAGPPDAPAVLLLPGAGATSLMWAPNIVGLSSRCRVWAIDSVADFGRSVPSKPVASASDFVAWLDELGAALSPSPFGLAGVSYGAWIAAQYGLARPERLSALALIAPAGTIMPLSVGFISRAVLCALPSPFFTRQLLTWLASDLAVAAPDVLAQRVAEGYLATRSFRPRRLVPPTVLRDEELRSLPRPTLFIVGENERLFVASAAMERLRRAAPEIELELELVPRAGHDVTLVAADIVNSLLLRLFA